MSVIVLRWCKDIENSCCSDPIGVVQGSSVLGPVLFSQFMNDLPDILGDKVASKRW